MEQMGEPSPLSGPSTSGIFFPPRGSFDFRDELVLEKL